MQFGNDAKAAIDRVKAQGKIYLFKVGDHQVETGQFFHKDASIIHSEEYVVQQIT